MPRSISISGQLPRLRVRSSATSRGCLRPATSAVI